MDVSITATLSYIVFAFGSLLVAIQVSSAQLTPRIIATTLLRDNVIRSIVGVFVYGLLIAVAVKNRMDAVPRFMISLAAIWGLVSTVAFPSDHYAARLLRPVTICWLVGERGLKVIRSIYPRPIDKQGRSTQARQETRPPRPDRRAPPRIPRSCCREPGGADRRSAASGRHHPVVPRVSDFVSRGRAAVTCARPARDDSRSQAAGRGRLRLGAHHRAGRSTYRLPHLIVDIAIKALSEAINDPTTAVVATGQLHRLLRAADSGTCTTTGFSTRPDGSG